MRQLNKFFKSINNFLPKKFFFLRRIDFSAFLSQIQFKFTTIYSIREVHSWIKDGFLRFPKWDTVIYWRNLKPLNSNTFFAVYILSPSSYLRIKSNQRCSEKFIFYQPIMPVDILWYFRLLSFRYYDGLLFYQTIINNTQTNNCINI